MRLPPALVTANFVLASAAILAAVFALGLWLFVLTNRGRTGQFHIQQQQQPMASQMDPKMEQFLTTDEVPPVPRHIPHNQQIREMLDGPPIQLDHLGMAPMGERWAKGKSEQQQQPKDDGGQQLARMDGQQQHLLASRHCPPAPEDDHQSTMC